jgi:hypothetical protein
MRSKTRRAKQKKPASKPETGEEHPPYAFAVLRFLRSSQDGKRHLHWIDLDGKVTLTTDANFDVTAAQLKTDDGKTYAIKLDEQGTALVNRVVGGEKWQIGGTVKDGFLHVKSFKQLSRDQAGGEDADGTDVPVIPDEPAEEGNL